MSEDVAVARAKEAWKAFFDTILCALIDYEMGPTQSEHAVRKAAALADLALDEYEKRWAQ